MLPFKDIYQKAIHLFDDPIIKKAFFEDQVRWEKLMYPYLENGLHRFTNPSKICFLLIDQTLPSGQMEILDGNGSNVYTLSMDVPENVEFSFTVEGQYVKNVVYNKTDNTVTFPYNIEVGKKLSVECYYPGCFNTDFKSAASATVTSEVIQYYVTDILANCLVLSWAEDEENFLLDIKNLLTDTDFKLYSPANSIKAKKEWVDHLIFNVDTQTNKLSWDLWSRKHHGGNFYG